MTKEEIQLAIKVLGIKDVKDLQVETDQLRKKLEAMHAVPDDQRDKSWSNEIKSLNDQLKANAPLLAEHAKNMSKVRNPEPELDQGGGINARGAFKIEKGLAGMMSGTGMGKAFGLLAGGTGIPEIATIGFAAYEALPYVEKFFKAAHEGSGRFAYDMRTNVEQFHGLIKEIEEKPVKFGVDILALKNAQKQIKDIETGQAAFEKAAESHGQILEGGGKKFAEALERGTSIGKDWTKDLQNKLIQQELPKIEERFKDKEKEVLDRFRKAHETAIGGIFGVDVDDMMRRGQIPREILDIRKELSTAQTKLTDEMREKIGLALDKAGKGVESAQDQLIGWLEEVGRVDLADTLRKAREIGKRAAERAERTMVEQEQHMISLDEAEAGIRSRARRAGIKLTQKQVEEGAEAAVGAFEQGVPKGLAGQMGMKAIDDKWRAAGENIDKFNAEMTARTAMAQMLPDMRDLAAGNAGVPITGEMVKSALQEATGAIAKGAFAMPAIYGAMNRQVMEMQQYAHQMQMFANQFNQMMPAGGMWGGMW